ncbi:hypothetical protein [Aminobacter sp. MDW-2]|uniref:hypothetical protein n=1 Tax=Aminobacter sp. MDW-2 TaxID=2666139 RepID=UPI0012B0803D|nr:hypothetical protein [Aminobacter sp. MDW-2]MRX32783.1 hypothetical protein [Aminobacter sp. MDW-2]QNH34555.1 hypothetical protein H5P29_00960 [Aminobacter sp. MDW-2]
MPELCSEWPSCECGSGGPDLCATPSATQSDADLCPVCLVPFKAGDTCATDIELGECHAECLEGSPVVDLETGEPSDGPITTYAYEPYEVSGGSKELLRPLLDALESDFVGDNCKNEPSDEPVGGSVNGPMQLKFGHIAALRDFLTSAPSEAEPIAAQRIREILGEASANDAAAGWRPCTGCHETNEGAETGLYPYSNSFGSYIGAGCSECGGLGVRWEHYSKAELDAMQHELAGPTTDADTIADMAQKLFDRPAFMTARSGPGKPKVVIEFTSLSEMQSFHADFVYLSQTTKAQVSGSFGVPSDRLQARVPANCRNRLRDEGKPYPRSGCASCGSGLMGCPYEPGARA